MPTWLNWREIERHNDWGTRSKNDKTANLWNKDAYQWEERSQRESEYNKRQVEALTLEPENSVLDICCGPGALTIDIAKRVKHVTAFDFSTNMLDYVKEKACNNNLTNISYIQGNWNTIEPGDDIKEHDIVITRHSPAQGDILKLSRFATKYCYSLWNCADHIPDGIEQVCQKSRWIRSEDEELNYSERPNPRLYGYNVHFNILYDMGANPTLHYVTQITELTEATIEDLYLSLYSSYGNLDQVPERIKDRDTKLINQLPDGRFHYYSKSKISVLGWNPNELNLECKDGSI